MKSKSKAMVRTWIAKRRGVASGLSGQILTGRAPPWLTPKKDRSGFDVVGDRADTVRRIFQLAAAGNTPHAIAEQLNGERVVSWRDPYRKLAQSWKAHYIARILDNHAVVGTLIPHKLVHLPSGSLIRKPLTPIPGYFPAIVGTDLFKYVQDVRGGRSVKRKGGSPNMKPLPRGSQADPSRSETNVLAGLARCPHCDGIMTRVTKWSLGERKQYEYLVCSLAKSSRTNKSCKYRTVPIPRIERALFELALLFDESQLNAWGELKDQIIVTKGSGDTDALARLKARQADVTFKLAMQLRMQERTVAPTPMDKRVELEAALTRLREFRDGNSNDVASVGRANLALRAVLAKVVVDYDAEVLRLHWLADVGRSKRREPLRY